MAIRSCFSTGILAFLAPAFTVEITTSGQKQQSEGQKFSWDEEHEMQSMTIGRTHIVKSVYDFLADCWLISNSCCFSMQILNLAVIRSVPDLPLRSPTIDFFFDNTHSFSTSLIGIWKRALAGSATTDHRLPKPEKV
jgi:hypothetical protein